MNSSDRDAIIHEVAELCDKLEATAEQLRQARIKVCNLGLRMMLVEVERELPEKEELH